MLHLSVLINPGRLYREEYTTMPDQTHLRVQYKTSSMHLNMLFLSGILISIMPLHYITTSFLLSKSLYIIFELAVPFFKTTSMQCK